MTDSGRERIYTGLEDTRHATRHAGAIENGWSKQCDPDHFPEQARSLSIDKAVSEAVERAHRDGRKITTVIDIGSGPQGVLVHDFLDPSQFSLTHESLARFPDHALRVVGVTSENSARIPGAVIGRKKAGNVCVENVPYTITRAHDLGMLMKEQRLEGIDFGLSNFGIGYFSPANFGHTLEEVARSLHSGGEFYGISYDHVPPGVAVSEQGTRYIIGNYGANPFPASATESIQSLRRYVATARRVGITDKAILSRLIDGTTYDYFEQLDPKKGATKLECILEPEEHAIFFGKRLQYIFLQFMIDRTLIPVLIEKTRQKKEEILQRLSKNPELNVFYNGLNLLVQKIDY